MDVRHNVIYTWDAMVRHVIDVQNFEVLSSFKFDSSMGRVVPEFVVWGAMGVAAMGASKAGKKIDDNEFFFRKTAQVMNEEKPRMQLTKQGFVNAAHDAWVELADVCRVCARAVRTKMQPKCIKGLIYCTGHVRKLSWSCSWGRGGQGKGCQEKLGLD